MSIPEKFRTQDERLEAVERAMASIIVTGTVVEADHKKGLYRIKYGTEGQEVDGPLVRPQEHAGTISSHMPFRLGQQVQMFSPDGKISNQSWIQPGGHSNDNPRHSDDGDAPGWKVGNASVTMWDGKVEVKVAGDYFRVEEGRIELNVGGNGVVLTAEQFLTTLKTVLNNGTRKVHFKGGKDDAGDKAVDGADEVFV